MRKLSCTWRRGSILLNVIQTRNGSNFRSLLSHWAKWLAEIKLCMVYMLKRCTHNWRYLERSSLKKQWGTTSNTRSARVNDSQTKVLKDLSWLRHNHGGTTAVVSIPQAIFLYLGNRRPTCQNLKHFTQITCQWPVYKLRIKRTKTVWWDRCLCCRSLDNSRLRKVSTHGTNCSHKACRNFNRLMLLIFSRRG
jgi:hypothetical protein